MGKQAFVLFDQLFRVIITPTISTSMDCVSHNDFHSLGLPASLPPLFSAFHPDTSPTRSDNKPGSLAKRPNGQNAVRMEKTEQRGRQNQAKECTTTREKV